MDYSGCVFLSVFGVLASAILASAQPAAPGGPPASAASMPNDAERLVQRFRPYFKFSVDNGGMQEPCRPCSWQWFAGHSELFKASAHVVTQADLQADPRRLLSPPDADVRKAADRTGPYVLRPNREGQAGEPWPGIIDNGDGLYAQCEDAGNNYVVLTYWALFGYNRATVLRAQEDHEPA